MNLRKRAVVAGMAAAPGLYAGAAGARFAARAATARLRGKTIERDVPAPAPSLALVGAFAADELLNMPMALLSTLAKPRDYRRASAELDEAVAYYGAAGWLEDPRGRHTAPTTPAMGDIEFGDGDGINKEVLRFESGWHPHDDEPGADRWRSFTANATVPVRLLRHPGPPRPWLVAVHGAGMGRPSDDRMLRVRRLHHKLGVNVAMPVLPLHGPRSAGFAVDRTFVSNLYVVNNVLGLTQSVWDLRRLLLWLRTDQHAPAVGVLGLSLGSYACDLLSTLEGDLACVIAVVPTTDLAASLRHAKPVTRDRRAQHRALHDERSIVAHSVVSPIAGPCLVPRDRRFIVAGQADRVARAAGAASLWRHWDEPSIKWMPRGHMTTPLSAAYDRYVLKALVASGLATERQGR